MKKDFLPQAALFGCRFLSLWLLVHIAEILRRGNNICYLCNLQFRPSFLALLTLLPGLLGALWLYFDRREIVQQREPSRSLLPSPHKEGWRELFSPQAKRHLLTLILLLFLLVIGIYSPWQSLGFLLIILSLPILALQNAHFGDPPVLSLHATRLLRRISLSLVTLNGVFAFLHLFYISGSCCLSPSVLSLYRFDQVAADRLYLAPYLNAGLKTLLAALLLLILEALRTPFPNTFLPQQVLNLPLNSTPKTRSSFPILQHLRSQNRLESICLLIACALTLAWLYEPVRLLLLRAYCLHAPNFDHGIFVQAYEQILKGHGFVSTVERDQLLSHLQVHVSPSLILLSPLYLLCRGSIGLEALQIIVILTGLLPLRQLTRGLGLPRALRYLLSGLYLWLPGITLSCFYDFHENCLLAPCLLALAASLVRPPSRWTWLLVALTLGIKEDAALYILCLGLYSLSAEACPDPRKRRRQRQRRTLQFILIPLIYFTCALIFLKQGSQGAMTGRYANLMSLPQLGLLGIPLAAFENPAYFLATMAQTKKLLYLLAGLASGGFLALKWRRPGRLFLILPFLIVNLLSNYPYQYQFGFQYHFGSSICLLILALLSLSDSIRSNLQQKRLLVSPLLLGLVFSVSFTHSFIKPYTLTEYLKNNSNSLKLARAELHHEAKHGGRLLASSPFIPELAQADELYELFYHRRPDLANAPATSYPPQASDAYDPSIDRILVDQRFPLDPGLQKILDVYEINGYQSRLLPSGWIKIYERP